MQEINETWETLITDFKFYLKLEKSLSDNSIDSYIRDISKLAKYYSDKEKGGKIEASKINLSDLN